LAVKKQYPERDSLSRKPGGLSRTRAADEAQFQIARTYCGKRNGKKRLGNFEK